MSARALEFVETWVSGKIEQMQTLPAEGDEAAAKTLANECFQAALDEDVPAAEIQEAFDNLAEFIAGEIEEARERKAGLSGDEGNEELLRKVEDEADEDGRRERGRQITRDGVRPGHHERRERMARLSVCMRGMIRFKI